MTFSQLYRRALLDARSNAQSLSTANVRRLAEYYRQAIRDVERDASANAISAERADALRRQLRERIGILEKRVFGGTKATVEQTVSKVVSEHVDAHRTLARAAGVTGPRAVRMASSLDAVNDRALLLLTARRRVPLATLVHRNMQDAIPDLDRLLGSAVSRGVSTRRVTKDIAYLLSGGDPAVADRELIDLSLYGLRDADVAGFKTLWSDARRIAVSETNNALRESNRASLEASTIVAGATWQLSGRHFVPDECDVIAGVDAYGLGRGVYPPERWPVAPHPYCACYQGDVVFRSTELWGTPRTSVPDLDVDPAAMRLPAIVREHGHSARRIASMRRNVAGALGVA